MVNNNQIGIGLVAIAALIALVALVAPWWALTMSGGGASMTQTAGPFNTNDDTISATAALLTGFLTLMAFLALAAATVLSVYGLIQNRQDNMIRNTPLMALGGAAVLTLSLVLAILLYPGDGNLGFWDSVGGAGGSLTSAAAWGWYLGIAGVLLSIVGAVLMLGEREESPAAPTDEGTTQ